MCEHTAMCTQGTTVTLSVDGRLYTGRNAAFLSSEHNQYVPDSDVHSQRPDEHPYPYNDMDDHGFADNVFDASTNQPFNASR